MKNTANTVDEYINTLPENRKDAIIKLREIISENLPSGFTETINYGMIGYVIDHKSYPAGYHANPSLPLPFINIASQKNHIAIYHMGIYSDKKLLKWFLDKYAETVATKIDMGKSCIRFKKPEIIPFDLIGELASKISPDEWVEKYENSLKK